MEDLDLLLFDPHCKDEEPEEIKQLTCGHRIRGERGLQLEWSDFKSHFLSTTS